MPTAVLSQGLRDGRNEIDLLSGMLDGAIDLDM